MTIDTGAVFLTSLAGETSAIFGAGFGICLAMAIGATFGAGLRIATALEVGFVITGFGATDLGFLTASGLTGGGSFFAAI
ncbi:MAG: hypothetical protein HN725_19745 [Alphaproteobacteria bacterium]|nr:hypothetical protein [Alphaproteobacteria bacterium]